MKETLRILLLEDLPTDAELVIDELELSGLDFEYKLVDNEKDFLDNLEHFQPDIVLSDYSLPTFNGMAALRLIKQRYPDLPVIMVTASINEETAVACMRAGAADYVLKDKMKRLGMAVRAVLENQELKLEKQKAELALQESGRYYRALLDQMNEHVIVIDSTYKITDVNKTFLENRGYARDEVIGQSCHMLLYGSEEPCNSTADSCKLPGVFETATPVRFIRQQNNKAGEKTWYSISMSPMLDNDGKVVAVIESSIDVTELMHAQEEIQKLSTAIEQSPVSIVLTNTNGMIEYVNPHFSLNTGYAREEVLGKNPSILKSGAQDSAFYKELWDTITKGCVWHGEFHNRKKDGSLFWEDATISPVLNDQGTITHFLAVKEDITERKRLGQELSQAQKMEAVGRLAGGVAHDFNNLLTVINGYSEIALSKLEPNDAMTKYINQIAQAGRKAGSLTEQLLAFSRKQVMQPIVLDTNKAIHDMGKMLRRLIGENINLQIKHSPDLPPIEADPAQFDQILINLAVNARDAMPDGGDLVVETTLVNAAETGLQNSNGSAKKWIRLAVSDTGIGMDDLTQQHIFEPFFSTKGKEGAGLGMATVYGIISQNGWHIDVASELGKGSIFYIYFPASTKSLTPERIVTHDIPLEGKETILFVEDETEVRSFVAGCLEQAGYKVIQAAEGGEALETAKSRIGEIDLLLSDVVMPNMGGKDLADSLRAMKNNLKVIFISGYTDETISRSGVLEKETILLQKPFSPQDLLKLVRSVLDAEEAVERAVPGTVIE